MTSNQIMFILFAVMIVVFSILTVTTRRILRAAVYLLFVLVSTSGLYFMLNFQFMAAVQLTLYAGGIVVLIIFSILFLPLICSQINAPVSFRVYILFISAMLFAIGTSTYSFPVFVVTTDFEWERIDLSPAMNIHL